MIIIGIVCIIILGVAIYINSIRQANESFVAQKAYTDPDRYFAIKIPANWQDDITHGTGKRHVGTPQEAANTIELVTLSSGDGVGVHILIDEATPSCKDVEKANTILAKLPATYNPKHYSWSIYTTRATYTISYYYPGTGVYHRHMPIDSLPVSHSSMVENQKIIDAIIASFLPMNLEPVRCE